MAVPIATPASKRVTVSPATPIPVIDGCTSLVMPSPTTPLSLSGLSTGFEVDGGSTVSITTGKGVDIGEVLPAGDVCVTVKLCAPSPSMAAGATENVPSSPTVAVPTAVPASNRVTVSPTVPVPVIEGCTTLVMPSPSTPLSLPRPRAGAEVADGAAVSMLTASWFEIPDTLAAESVSVTEIACSPSGSTALGNTENVPSTPTTALPIAAPSLYRVMVSPTVPVPVNEGCTTLVRLSPRTPLSLAGASIRLPTAAGGVVSIVTLTGADRVELLPAASVSPTAKL